MLDTMDKEVGFDQISPMSCSLLFLLWLLLVRHANLNCVTYLSVILLGKIMFFVAQRCFDLVISCNFLFQYFCINYEIIYWFVIFLFGVVGEVTFRYMNTIPSCSVFHFYDIQVFIFSFFPWFTLVFWCRGLTGFLLVLIFKLAVHILMVLFGF